MLVTFDDGKCALYSAALLHDILPRATEVNVRAPDEE
jgi:hypothetical protein